MTSVQPHIKPRSSGYSTLLLFGLFMAISFAMARWVLFPDVWNEFEAVQRDCVSAPAAARTPAQVKHCQSDPSSMLTFFLNGIL